MNLGQVVPDATLVWWASVTCLAVLAAAIVSAPWRGLMARRERQNALGVAIVVLPILWSMTPELPAGIKLHLLGMTTVALVFGWQLAVVIGAIAGIILVVVGSWQPVALPVNVLLVVILPVLVTMAVLGAANRLRRTNLFVYMLGVAFGGAILAILMTFLIGNWLLEPGLDHAVVLLLAFPEGFINGCIVSALAVFHPELVRTYDDVRYLGKGDGGG